MLKLNPEPTFKQSVDIPLAGGAKAPVEFEFRYQTVAEYIAFSERVAGGEFSSSADVLSQVIVGWSGVDQPYTREALDKLLDTYHAAAEAIGKGYRESLTQERAKN